MPKPIAYVSSTSAAMTGRVTVDVPDATDQWAHGATALYAAQKAAGEWGTLEGHGVSIAQPVGVRRFGGGMLREAIAAVTSEVRDAAKASLRANGYTVSLEVGMCRQTCASRRTASKRAATSAVLAHARGAATHGAPAGLAASRPSLPPAGRWRCEPGAARA